MIITTGTRQRRSARDAPAQDASDSGPSIVPFPLKYKPPRRKANASPPPGGPGRDDPDKKSRGPGAAFDWRALVAGGALLMIALGAAGYGDGDGQSYLRIKRSLAVQERKLDMPAATVANPKKETTAKAAKVDASANPNGNGLMFWTEEDAEEKPAEAFPAGCSWECYLANNPDLPKNLPRTEEAALKHYNQEGWRDCECGKAAAEGAKAPAGGAKEREITVYGGGEPPKTEPAKAVYGGGEQAEAAPEPQQEAAPEPVPAEAAPAEVVPPAAAGAAASFPSGCSRECYVANHPELAAALPTEQAAINHFLEFGMNEGKDCRCKDAQAGAAPVEPAPVEPAPVEAAPAEVPPAAGGAGARFPAGCSRACYLANHPELAVALPTEEAAANHFLEFGFAEGKDCRCK